jgi:hypothetical protein
MSNLDNGVLAAKLDILIADFQEFKKDQKETNRELRLHSVAEDKVQATIASTVKWHTIIGTFMMGIIAYHIKSHGI